MPAFAELFRTSVVLYAFARGQALCGRAFVFDEFLNLGRGEGLMDFIRCVSVEDHFRPRDVDGLLVKFTCRLAP